MMLILLSNQHQLATKNHRVATRYDKLLANFMGFVKLDAILIWLK